MKNKTSLKQKILDSIKFAREELKYTLVSDEWGNASTKCACALGCVLLNDDPKDVVRIEDEKDRYPAIKEILKVDESWVDSFIEGFDGNGIADQSKVPDAWTLGQEVAKETKPIEYHKWDGEYHG